MIIVLLMGGLGNQMFQYAAGRRLAHLHNTSLKLDLSFINNNKDVVTARKYELDVFNIKADFSTVNDVDNVKKNKTNFSTMLLEKLKIKFIPFHKHSYIRERQFHFDPDILKVGDNVYLEGYWQTAKYFNDIESIIRHDFQIARNLDKHNNKIASVIMNCNSVSIHVRRGDYISDKMTNQYHGMCSLDYYINAINLIRSKIDNPSFFVFSDEPEWMKANLKIDDQVSYVDINGKDKAYEDLRLMSLCKHNIIANSSFSWWGAWLNNNPNKKVIAPIKWFNDKSINTTDLIPENWLRI